MRLRAYQRGMAGNLGHGRLAHAQISPDSQRKVNSSLHIGCSGDAGEPLRGILQQDRTLARGQLLTEGLTAKAWPCFHQAGGFAGLAGQNALRLM